MSESLKRKVVGCAALVVIAAAVLPIFFNGEGYKERHAVNQIPTAPQPPQAIALQQQNSALPNTAELAAPAEPAVVAAPVEPLKQSVEKAEPELEPAKDTPALDNDQVPIGWTLQLATFSDESNAKALKAELEKQDNSAVYIRRLAGFWKVYVGPEMQKSKLEALQEKLKREYALDGIIIRYSAQ